MKNIGSRNITGPEAILTAIVKWWLKSLPNLEDSIKQELLTIDPKLLTGKIDYKLGEVFFRFFPMERMIKHFWFIASTNETTRFMIELATQSCKNKDRVNQTKELVKKLILSEIGQIILKQRVNH